MTFIINSTVKRERNPSAYDKYFKDIYHMRMDLFSVFGEVLLGNFFSFLPLEQIFGCISIRAIIIALKSFKKKVEKVKKEKLIFFNYYTSSKLAKKKQRKTKKDWYRINKNERKKQQHNNINKKKRKEEQLNSNLSIIKIYIYDVLKRMYAGSRASKVNIQSKANWNASTQSMMLR